MRKQRKTVIKAVISLVMSISMVLPMVSVSAETVEEENNILYYENFDNISGLATEPDGDGFYPLDNNVKIHKGDSDVTIKDGKICISPNSAWSTTQYQFYNAIEINNKTSISFAMSRDVSGFISETKLFVNTWANNEEQKAISVTWNSDDTLSAKFGGEEAGGSGKHQSSVNVNIILDRISSNAYVYADNDFIGKLDVSGITDWRLSKINFLGSQASKEEVCYDDIKVAAFNFSKGDIDENSAIIYPCKDIIGDNDNVYVDFGSEIDQNTLGNISIADENGEAVEYKGVYDLLNSRYNLDFTKLKDAKYTVTVSNVKSVAGDLINEVSSVFQVARYYQDFESVDEMTMPAGTETHIDDASKVIPNSEGLSVGYAADTKAQGKVLKQSSEGWLMSQYIFNGNISLPERTVYSFDRYRGDNMSDSYNLYWAKENNDEHAVSISWNDDNTINFGETKSEKSYENGWHHFEVINDAYSDEAFLYVDNDYVGKVNIAALKGDNGYELSRIVWWTNGTSYIDNIAVYSLKTALPQEGISINLEDNATGVSTKQEIIINFGKLIKESSITDSTIALTSGGEAVEYDGVYDVKRNAYRIIPNTTANNVYKLSLSDMAAADGSVIKGKDIKFKTALYSQDFEDTKLEFDPTTLEANLGDSNNSYIHKGDADVGIEEENGRGNVLRMDMKKFCQVQYTLRTQIENMSHNLVDVGYNLYVDKPGQNLYYKINFGSGAEINNDAYSIELKITADGAIESSESGVIGIGWNKLDTVIDFSDMSAVVYANGKKVIDKYVFSDAINPMKEMAIGKISFHTYDENNTDENKYTYKIDDINIKTNRDTEVKPALKNASGSEIITLSDITTTEGVKGAFEIRNNGFETGKELKLIMAHYRNGQLMDITTANAAETASGKNYVCNDLSFAKPQNTETGDMIKLFVWENENMNPILTQCVIK